MHTQEDIHAAFRRLEKENETNYTYLNHAVRKLRGTQFEKVFTVA